MTTATTADVLTQDTDEVGERAARWMDWENSGKLPELLRYAEFYSLLFRPACEWV